MPQILILATSFHVTGIACCKSRSKAIPRAGITPKAGPEQAANSKQQRAIFRSPSDCQLPAVPEPDGGLDVSPTTAGHSGERARAGPISSIFCLLITLLQTNQLISIETKSKKETPIQNLYIQHRHNGQGRYVHHPAEPLAVKPGSGAPISKNEHVSGRRRRLIWREQRPSRCDGDGDGHGHGHEIGCAAVQAHVHERDGHLDGRHAACRGLHLIPLLRDFISAVSIIHHQHHDGKLHHHGWR